MINDVKSAESYFFKEINIAAKNENCFSTVSCLKRKNIRKVFIP